MYSVYWGAPWESSKKLVIFDVDGTLNMTELYAIPAYKKILEKMGAEGFTDEMLKNRIGAAFMDDIRYFFGNRAEERKEEFEELVEEYWLKDVESKAKTFPHVNQTLQELIEKGYHLAICSNAEEDEIARVIKALHIEDYFRYVQGITKQQTKSHSLHRLLEKVRPEWAVMVGDRFYDKEAAEDNGIPFIACLYGYGKEGEFSGNELSITDICQLPSVVEGQRRNGVKDEIQLKQT